MASRYPRRLDWLVPGSLLVIIGLTLWLAPEERTLGQGIKSVYLHVGLTWTGLAGLGLTALMGLGVAVVGSGRLLAWTRTVAWISLGMFAAGLAASLLSAWINWGGVFWSEPRTRAALNTLLLGMIIQIAGGWLLWKRVRGGLYVLPALGLAWSTANTPLVLHPRNPIATATSPAIQLTFLWVFALCTLMAVWLAWRLHGRLDPGPERHSL